MTKKVSLTVNDVPIKLDFFVEGYVEHVTAGILASLKDTGEIKDLELDIDNEGQVKINLNGSEVPLSYFPIEIIRNTVFGMVSNLKGVNQVERLKITIIR